MRKGNQPAHRHDSFHRDENDYLHSMRLAMLPFLSTSACFVYTCAYRFTIPPSTLARPRNEGPGLSILKFSSPEVPVYSRLGCSIFYHHHGVGSAPLSQWVAVTPLSRVGVAITTSANAAPMDLEIILTVFVRHCEDNKAHSPLLPRLCLRAAGTN